MRSPVITPDRLFDRLWQPGHPFRPRRSNGRRWTMISLLIILSICIGAYWWVTDPERIRDMARSYLSELTGGKVDVKRASLSIFEGLKLYGVTLRVDDADSPDSVLFVADTFDIQYNPASLLRGNLEATRIIATGPHVQVAEDVDSGKWNYQKLSAKNGQPRTSTRPVRSKENPLILPEVILRNAEVEYTEYRGMKRSSRGTMALEGRLSPSSDNSHFNFELQSRGTIEGVGPVVSGTARMDTGQVIASLSNFHFGRDVEAMLPSQVRDWWQGHQLEGGLDIPDFNYTPPTANRPATFHVRTHLEHVRLAIRADEIAGDDRHRLPDRPHQATDLLRHLGLGLAGQSVEIESFIAPPPIAVDDVSGDFTFDDNRISFEKVTGKVEHNTLLANGVIAGYSPDAPFHVHLESLPGAAFNLPRELKIAASLPTDARNIYNMFKPHGDCTLWLGIDRKEPGSRPQITGEINVLQAETACIFFPYPIQGATGKIVFGGAENGAFEHVEIQNLRGHGLIGGPNENAFVTVGGWVGPFDNTVGCNIRVIGDNVISEPALFTAFPKEVRDALTIFTDDTGSPATQPAQSYPKFRGNFLCDIIMPIGPATEATVSTDITLLDASGRLAAFPYPLQNLTGLLQIREGYLNIVNIAMKHGGAAVVVNGKVSWTTKTDRDHPPVVTPAIAIHALNIPIDDNLLNALPENKRSWLKKIGLTGTIDVNGNIFAAADSKKTISNEPRETVDFTVDLDLHNGSVWPIDKSFAATDVAGHIHFANDRLELTDFKGHRGEADLFASGAVDLSADHQTVSVNAGAKNLSLDESLHRLLPANAQNVWDSINPVGNVDLDVTYAGPVGPPANAEPSSSYSLTLTPRALSVTPKVLPYRLDECTGTVTASSSGIQLNHFSGKHGKATITVAGTGDTRGAAHWDLSLLAKQVPVDSDLLAAIPASFKKEIKAFHFNGDITLDLKQLKYQAKEDEKAPADFDVAGTIGTSGGSLELGVPLRGVTGGMTFESTIRNEKLSSIVGTLNFESLQVAERPLRNLKAELNMPADSDHLLINNIEGELAGGQFAGNVNLKLPEQGAAGYSLNIVLKNADVSTVSGLGSDIRGQLSASLALEGEWADVSTRRGRGDVLVAGQKMYQIPLVLGLFEITNLSLPSTNPFNEGTARYAVDGKRITFDQIQMRSASMVMDGSGYMDFGSKKVRMNFSTDNPNMPKLPFVHDLWQGAKQELFQIQVRGSIQEPKVSAASLHTFTTTVDEVFSGNRAEK